LFLFLLTYNQLCCSLFSVHHATKTGTTSTTTTKPTGDELEECISSKEVRAMMKAMTELFMKNQQSTDTTLEWVECSIAEIIDRVDALETRLPPMNQNKLPDKTREDDYDEVEEVEDEEPFDPPCPPPRWQHHNDQKVHQELPRPPR
jgi:hypothetical protein